VKAFLDTHAAVLLYAGKVAAFGAPSRALMERSTIFVSPFVRLELQMLREMGRISRPADEILGALEADLGLAVSKDPVDAVVAKAVAMSWTRDPFDRLLVATAALHSAPFVTRDVTIAEHYRDAIW
jgi:PIN domain nuclease of toxin-antitoxin system